MRRIEPRTYRATREAWLGQLLLPLVFFALLTYTAVDASELNPWVGGIGLTVLALVAAFDYLLPMTRNWLRAGERTFEGSLDGRAFHIYWTEVLAAWLFRRGRRRYLCLGTGERTYILPLRFLDGDAVWQMVRSSAPPDALTPEAMQRLPDYREWQTARTWALSEAAPSTVADHWMILITGWAGMTFFLFGFFATLPRGSILAAGLFAALTVVCLAALLNWGITEFTEQGVQRVTLFGGSRMNWEDMRWIEIDPFDSTMVLVGDDCQMVIPGPAMWAGGKKKKGLAMLLSQAEQHGVPLRRTSLALTRRSRKTSARR